MGDIARLVLLSSTIKPGCYDKPRLTDESGYWTLERVYPYNDPKLPYHLENRWIPFRLSKKCMNDFQEPMPGCDGCKHKRISHAVS